MMRSPYAYRAVDRGFADNFLAVSPTYGRFLYAITRAKVARRLTRAPLVVEGQYY
jgi:hypothetical protein